MSVTNGREVDGLIRRLEERRYAYIEQRKALEAQAVAARQSLYTAKKITPGHYVPDAEWHRLQERASAHKVRCAALDRDIAALNAQLRGLRQRVETSRGPRPERGLPHYFVDVAERRLSPEVFEALMDEARTAFCATEGLVRRPKS